MVVRKALKLLKVVRCVIAVDVTKELYWGRNGFLNVRGIKHERGADEAWEWVVVSMVKPFPLPLMALPYRQGADLATLTIDLLRFVKSLGVQVDAALFDRGFYNAHLIDFLEAGKWRYLILVPENERMAFYAKHTTTMRAFKHTMRYQKEMSTWKPRTKIVVIKQVKKGKSLFDLFFATSLPAGYGLLRLYPKRWGIETTFRVMDEAKIKSKSNYAIIRYFYFMVQLVLYIGWNLTRTLIKTVPFKKYLFRLTIQTGFLRQGVT